MGWLKLTIGCRGYGPSIFVAACGLRAGPAPLTLVSLGRNETGTTHTLLARSMTQLKTLVALAAGYTTLAVLAWCAYYVHQPPNIPEFALTVAIGATGLAVGWVIGLLASPYEAAETKRFAALTTAVTSFVSGYVLSKLDPVITAALKPETALAADRISLLRILAFGCSVLVGGVTMYSYRAYIGPHRRAEVPAEQEAPAVSPHPGGVTPAP